MLSCKRSWEGLIPKIKQVQTREEGGSMEVFLPFRDNATIECPRMEKLCYP